MNFILALLLANHGVQVRTPDTDKFEIVRTDSQPKENHHPVMDSYDYKGFLPFTVTIKAHSRAIHTIGVVFNIDGMDHAYVFTMPVGRYVIERNRSVEFFPGGRMSRDIGNPLMSADPSWITSLENARSVTFTIDFIEFEDGTAWGPDTHGNKRTVERFLKNRSGK